MRTTYKLISGILLVFLLIPGCNLDTMPFESKDVDQLHPSELGAITLGSYSYMKENNGLMRTYHYFGEYGGDNISLSGSTSDALIYIYNYQRVSQNSRVGDLWMHAYKTIVNINKAIELGEVGVSKEIDRVIGENYYLRAMHYLFLCNIFGTPYVNNPTRANSGIPLKLTSDPTDYPTRATVEEVYKRIISDLEKAIELMDLTGSGLSPKNNCYATKEAAEALLSRVYLYMGNNWKEVNDYATSVIESNRFSLESSDRFSNYPTFVPEDNKETIFAVRYTKDIDYPSEHRNYMIGSMYAKIDGDGWGEMYASDSYLRLLELHPEDVRNSFIRKQYKNDDSYWFIYYEEVKEGDATSYVYRMQPVVKIDEEHYEVVESDKDKYANPQVQTKPFNGGTAFYLTTSNNREIIGRVEAQTTNRNDYPEYYIYKCSLQEGQGHMWSPVISRLAEMYLNRAEARYHQGNLQGALDDINLLRTRAKIPNWTMSNIPSGKTVLDLVLEERRLELAFEAQRRMDIYRTRGTLDRRYPGGHLLGSPESVRLEVPYTDNAVVEYIPQRELDAYPIKLEQNP